MSDKYRKKAKNIMFEPEHLEFLDEESGYVENASRLMRFLLDNHKPYVEFKKKRGYDDVPK